MSNVDLWFAHYRPAAGDVIIDVGAGKGEDLSDMSAAVGPTGYVWAIEAHPDFCRLARRASAELMNVGVYRFACVGQERPVHIEAAAEWESTALLAEPSKGSCTVPGIRLDTFALAHEIGNVAFLKMNIEGAELEALPGATEVLKRTRNACICAHDFRADRGEGKQFRTRSFVCTFLRTSGFDTEIVPGWDHVHAWRVS